MEALFSTVELADGEGRSEAGFRLARVELLNWGTFDRRVWSLQMDGRNGLLTGDIGSGKSTVVDAVTTLLLPAARISYNKAAGAESSERSLRSYVSGYYKSERVEASRTGRPVGMRTGNTFSVLLGVFRNQAKAYDSTVTLAQVFWQRAGETTGQPDRFYVVSAQDLSIGADFADFGTEIVALKRRLRASGATVYDHFPEYGRDYRRRLGVPSEQAMELFHQTVSMKSVGSLDDFVRRHMLEPFDARSWIDRLVAHFADLSAAHEAVVRARRQLADLEPLLEVCDAHEELDRRVLETTARRDALSHAVGLCRVASLERSIQERQATLQSLARQRDEAQMRIDALDASRERLSLQRAGLGGDRLAQIEHEVTRLGQERDQRQRRSASYEDLLEDLGLGPVSDAEAFDERAAEAGALAAAVGAEVDRLRDEHADRSHELTKVNERRTELNDEIRSLQARDSNLPRERLALRTRLVESLGIPEDELPFVGELVRVADEHRDWEGAAERLLRGFALSLLVPDERYAEVAQWINDHHLGTKLVYYRVREAERRAPPAASADGAPALHLRLEVKESPFFAWLRGDLSRRADHRCVDTMVEFRHEERAITRQGQIKHSRTRHEKDDARRIDDRKTYVLGWTNERKILALLDEAAQVERQHQELHSALAANKQASDEATVRAQAVGWLAAYDRWDDIDWRSVVAAVEDLHAEKRRLEAASGELQRVVAELERVNAELSAARDAREGLGARIHTEEDRLGSEGRRLGDTRAQLTSEPTPDSDVVAAVTEAIRAIASGDQGATIEDQLSQLDDAERTLRTQLTKERDGLIDSRDKRARRVIALMGRFRQAYPAETAELDDALESVPGYRELHARLTADDLPRFEASFKRYLNENTIRDVAGFQSALHKEAAVIRERVALINESLQSINYNPGRYIRLEAARSTDPEVRDFDARLRACTEHSLSGDDTEQYSERKFLEVKGIIERFTGREGLTDVDRAWTRHVTDVRTWFVFSASERYREDDEEHEHYSDSGGKSGGQKEKLAYTILAASLAYQFRLDQSDSRSKTFRFVVIDEAFGRGSDESARFALDLFGRLGLQLLVVTPLQKIHVIDPFVSAVGYVENPTGQESRLLSMTIEEYRKRQAAHRLTRSHAAPPPVPTA